MSASTRRKTAYITAGCVLLAAVGVRYGYTHAAFFLPGATAELLFGLERQAKRAARERPRHRQDVHGVATDAPAEGVNLQDAS